MQKKLESEEFDTHITPLLYRYLHTKEKKINTCNEGKVDEMMNEK